MSFVDGQGTAVALADVDLSAYSNTVTFTRTADSHETSTFGGSSKVYATGLGDGTATIEGIYDNTEDVGPGAVLRPLVGADVVELHYRPEGHPVGAPSAFVYALVTSYEESSAVADMVTWSAELQFSDEITDGAIPEGLYPSPFLYPSESLFPAAA